MIDVTKSQPAPGCLQKEKRKANGNYRCGDVVKRIKEDFKNKCYICEYKRPPSINVEHFIPHKGNKDKKFDWNNLFYACAHCNNTKLDKFDNILDCTNPEHDVTNWIKYKMEFLPEREEEKVKISAQKKDKKVHNTVELLLRVYNGTSTPIKEVESHNIRLTLRDDLKQFQEHLLAYYEEETEDHEKEIHLRIIKKHLNKCSAFTAFKRWIIKDNSRLCKDFEQYFD